MKTIIILLTLIVTINCQAADPGFRLDALKILGNDLNNNGLNNGFNNGQLNNNGLNNGFDLNNGLNSGLSNQNGMMGMMLSGQSTNTNNQMMGMMSGSQSTNTNNQIMMTSSNNYGALPQMPAIPQFTDKLQYPQPSQPAQPVPVPSGPEATLGDYKPEDLKDQAITAPGRYAPITNVPQLPVLIEQPVYGSRSRTASLKNDQSANNPDWKQFLFPFEVPTNPGVMPSRNQGADDTIDRYLANIGIPNQSQFKNGLFQNQNTASNYGLNNNGLNNNMNSGLFNSGLYNNLATAATNAGSNYALNDNGLNNNMNSGLSSNLVPSTLPYNSADKLPIDFQYSTKIQHNQPAKLLSQTGPYQLKPNGF